MLLYVQLKSKIGGNGLSVIRRNYKELFEELELAYPNSIKRNTFSKLNYKSSEKRIKKIVYTKIDLTRSETRMLNGALVCAKIEDNQQVINFIADRKL